MFSLQKTLLLWTLFGLILLPSMEVLCEPRCNWVGIKIKDGETFYVGNYTIMPIIIEKLGQFLIRIEKDGILHGAIQYFPSKSPTRMASIRERGNYSNIVFYVFFDRDKSTNDYAYIEIRNSKIFPPYAFLEVELINPNISHTHLKQRNVIGRQSDVVKILIRNKGNIRTNASIMVFYEAQEGDFEGYAQAAEVSVAYPRELFIEAGESKVFPINISVNRTQWCVSIRITVLVNYTTPWITEDMVNFRYREKNASASTTFLVRFFEKQKIETPKWEGRPVPSAIPAYISKNRDILVLSFVVMFVLGLMLRSKAT